MEWIDSLRGAPEGHAQAPGASVLCESGMIVIARNGQCEQPDKKCMHVRVRLATRIELAMIGGV